MSVKSQSLYRCPPMGELARQLLFAPADKRAEQVHRAERLHDQIDPAVDYPFEFISYRVTAYRSEREHPTLLPGKDVLPDLRRLIDTLSRSVRLPAAPQDQEQTVAELAAGLKVSTKTVQRWRDLGLRWRWTTPAQARKRLVFPRQAVDRFLAQHSGRIERAARFTQLSPAERSRIIQRARAIVAAREATLNQVATHLARRTGRAVETIRQMIQQHDRDHPRQAVFANPSRPLTTHQKRVIVRAYRMGVSPTLIARHFKRTRTTIHRVIRQQRALALARLPLTFVASPTFSRADADEVILRPEPPEGPASTPHVRHSTLAAINDLPEPLNGFFDSPPLSAQRQLSLLIRFNYLKFKAHGLRASLDCFDPRAADLDRIEQWLAQSATIRQRLVLAGLRVLAAVAVQHLVDQPDQSLPRLLKLLDLGHDVVLQAIDEFDASRGQTYESHLTWLLMRRFATHQMDRARLAQAHRRPDAQILARRIAAALENPYGAATPGHPPH